MGDVDINLQVPEVEAEISDGTAMLLSKCFIMFGGIVPFIPQYLEIMNTQDAQGFSTYVCLVVVVSNVLRIAYWVGHWFDTALLYQSIIMTCVMMILLEICLRMERKRAEATQINFREVKFRDFDWNSFWKWTDLGSYVEFTLSLLIASTVYATIFKEREYLIEPLGYLALLSEAGLGAPQFIKNYQNQSTEGMNVMMIVLWTVGDAVKAYFFFATLQPLPFRMCAVIQLLLDTAIFYQIAKYK